MKREREREKGEQIVIRRRRRFTMGRSLEFYYNIIFWTNCISFILYGLVKLLTIVLYLISINSACECHRIVASLKKTAINLIQWIILQLGSGQLERTDTDENMSDSQLTIRGCKKPLYYSDTMVLAMLIIEFGILALNSAISLALLDTSYTCTEDPLIDCYPQLIESDDTNSTAYNITIDISQPIQNCSIYDNEDVSNLITFDCFQLVYNTHVFLTVMGGLASFFTTALKISVGVLLWLSTCCKCRYRCCGIRKCRYFVVIVATSIELLLAGLSMLIIRMGGKLADEISNSTILKFAAMYATQIVLAFGVFNTLLLLHWEEYGNSTKSTSTPAAADSITKTKQSVYNSIQLQ